VENSFIACDARQEAFSVQGGNDGAVHTKLYIPLVIRGGCCNNRPRNRPAKV